MKISYVFERKLGSKLEEIMGFKVVSNFTI